MTRVERNRRLWWSISLVILVISGTVAIFFHQIHRRTLDAEPPMGRNILGGITSLEQYGELLGKLDWADVAATAEGVGTNKALASEVVAIAESLRHPPTLYLRGLLLLAAGDPQSALQVFDQIPKDEIPPAYLYAPYRLHNAVRPLETNKLRNLMIHAVGQRDVAPLIQARVLAVEGRLPEALKAYLQTDPGMWTALDVQNLRSLRMHAALANSTAVMIQGALKGGRVPGNVRPDLVKVLNAPQDAATLNLLKTQLLAQLERNPDIRRAAITGAVQQLTARQHFVAQRYRELLEHYRGCDALELPDEAVLLLLLSAARVQEASAFEQWSQELKRRYPTPAVERWVQELRTPAP